MVNKIKFTLELIRDILILIAFFTYLMMSMVWCALCKVLHNDDDVEIVDSLKKDEK